MPADELPRCPKCGIALDVPDELRGKVIRCLECQTNLQSPPLGSDGQYRIITRGRYPAIIFLPVATLMLLGMMGVVVNGYFAWQFRHDPKSIAAYTESTIASMNALNPVGKDKAKKDAVAPQLSEEEREKQLAAFAAENGREMSQTMLIFAGISAVALLGGIAFAMGRWSWLAGLGCLAAIGNLNHGCCFPGAIAGIWGLFAILSNEGQRHFGKTS